MYLAVILFLFSTFSSCLGDACSSGRYSCDFETSMCMDTPFTNNNPNISWARGRNPRISNGFYAFIKHARTGYTGSETADMTMKCSFNTTQPLLVTLDYDIVKQSYLMVFRQCRVGDVKTLTNTHGIWTKASFALPACDSHAVEDKVVFRGPWTSITTVAVDNIVIQSYVGLSTTDGSDKPPTSSPSTPSQHVTATVSALQSSSSGYKPPTSSPATPSQHVTTTVSALQSSSSGDKGLITIIGSSIAAVFVVVIVTLVVIYVVRRGRQSGVSREFHNVLSGMPSSASSQLEEQERVDMEMPKHTHV